MHHIPMLENECWYAAVSAYGDLNPMDGKTAVTLPFRNNPTLNQMTALLLSSRGRFIYGEQGFTARIENGVIHLDDAPEAPIVEQAGHTLKEAYLAFIRRFDKSPDRPISLDLSLIDRPLYNTWIELTFHQNQQDILAYASSLLDNGFAPGTLIIDDGWSDYYGKWRFSKERFSDAAAMIARLKAMGFHVMVWLVPYVTPDTQEYRELLKAGCLLMDGAVPYALRWWNGISACLDLRKEAAVEYLKRQLDALRAIGVDGFKFDGGDSLYYLPEHEPDRQSALWARLASAYPFNELRADFNTQGLSLMERLSDKKHAWGQGGLASLIPDTLALGLAGHPFSSPDMIGGGEYTCFLDLAADELDTDLIIKNTAVAALMPVVQFSVNPARVMPKHLPALHALLAVRQNMRTEYLRLARQALTTKEPIIRYMEYEFPHCGLERVTDQFMLGERYLIAPQYRQHAAARQVVLPKGRWRDADGTVLGDPDANTTVSTASLLAVYERL